jgi:hypothetical protein
MFTGENFELRAELNSEYRDRRADAIKRVIANMTVGKDVSGLFPDVLKNMVSLVYGKLNREHRELMVDVALQQTEDLEQKKVSY